MSDWNVTALLFLNLYLFFYGDFFFSLIPSDINFPLIVAMKSVLLKYINLDFKTGVNFKEKVE